MHDGKIPPPVRVAVLGNYPPRHCGIATFTADVHAALADVPRLESFVVAMDDETGLTYKAPVRHVIPQSKRPAYAKTGRRLRDEADVILLQHEYGIFGGEEGDWLFDLLDAADLPVVTTLHTILAKPSAAQRRVLTALADRSARVVSMSSRGCDMLEHIYGVTAAHISRIPHGVPERPYVEPSVKRAELGWEERPTVLTFGLLGTGKGLETMIDAVALLAQDVPDVRYIILGATHPHLVRHEGGERYRDGLKERVRERGVERNVEFVNRFVELDELCSWLQAADIYVTPYRNEAQITSGTLAYAHGLGKPIVSTPYWHAAELLKDRPEQLVPFDDEAAFARSLRLLIANEDLRRREAKRAFAASRSHVWRRIGPDYGRHLKRAAHASRPDKFKPASDTAAWALEASLKALRGRLVLQTEPNWSLSDA